MPEETVPAPGCGIMKIMQIFPSYQAENVLRVSSRKIAV